MFVPIFGESNVCTHVSKTFHFPTSESQLVLETIHHLGKTFSLFLTIEEPYTIFYVKNESGIRDERNTRWKFETNSNEKSICTAIQSGFTVKHKVGNVGILYCLRSERQNKCGEKLPQVRIEPTTSETWETQKMKTELCILLSIYVKQVFYSELPIFPLSQITYYHKPWWTDQFDISNTFELFHNSRLIRQIEQNNFKKNRDFTRDWTHIACLAVSHSNHYTRMFSLLLWGCRSNWILFMHQWFCPIERKSFHYSLQTKFAKVMISQVFVCPQGGLSVLEGLCP